MRALIIEDERLIAWMLEDLLSELGIEQIDTASTETAAVAAAVHNCPDLIIADCHISQGSGVAAVRTICADKSIPTIFVTGDQARATSAFPDAKVLEKPLGSDEFVDAVRSMFPTARAQ